MTDKELKALKNTLPDDRNFNNWSDTQKHIFNMILCIEMINSCLIYNNMDKFYKTYIYDYIPELEREEITDLIETQKEEIKKAKIKYNAYEGYHAIKWYDDI